MIQTRNYPRKSLGQNFLKDENIPPTITCAKRRVQRESIGKISKDRLPPEVAWFLCIGAIKYASAKTQGDTGSKPDLVVVTNDKVYSPEKNAIPAELTKWERKAYREVFKGLGIPED